MRLRFLGDFAVAYPCYGGWKIFPFKWWWQVLGFYAWYCRYYWIWHDDVVVIDG